MKRLNLVGAGRVGQTLAQLWQRQGVFEIQDICTRSLASATQACDFIGAGQPVASLQRMRSAELWMLAVPDAQVAATAQALALAGQASAGAFHCSGAYSSALLAPLAEQGWQVGSAHCILSFVAPRVAVEQFSGTACAIEGQAPLCDTLHAAFAAIGAQCFDVASAHKLLYHAGAVFATNFIPVLQTIAEDAWRATGVPDNLIPALRSSLLRNAVANVERLGPQAALTGPASRGDLQAIAAQTQAVAAWDAQAAAAYAALSDLALRMANANKDKLAQPDKNH